MILRTNALGVCEYFYCKQWEINFREVVMSCDMFGWLVIALESDKSDVNVDGDVRSNLVFLEKRKRSILVEV